MLLDQLELVLSRKLLAKSQSISDRLLLQYLPLLLRTIQLPAVAGTSYSSFMQMLCPDALFPLLWQSRCILLPRMLLEDFWCRLSIVPGNSACKLSIHLADLPQPVICLSPKKATPRHS